jgi:hypothetical protein
MSTGIALRALNVVTPYSLIAARASDIGETVFFNLCAVLKKLNILP